MLVRAMDIGVSLGIFLSSLSLCLTHIRRHKTTVLLLLSACIADPSLSLKVIKEPIDQTTHAPATGAPARGDPLPQGPLEGPLGSSSSSTNATVASSSGAPQGGGPLPRSTNNNNRTAATAAAAAAGQGPLLSHWPRTREDVFMRVCSKLNGTDFGYVSLIGSSSFVCLALLACMHLHCHRMQSKISQMHDFL